MKYCDGGTIVHVVYLEVLPRFPRQGLRYAPGRGGVLRAVVAELWELFFRLSFVTSASL